MSFDLLCQYQFLDSEKFSVICKEDTMYVNLTKKYLPIPDDVDIYEISWQDVSCDETLEYDETMGLKTRKMKSVIT